MEEEAEYSAGECQSRLSTCGIVPESLGIRAGWFQTKGCVVVL